MKEEIIPEKEEKIPEIEETPDFESNYSNDWSQLLKERITAPESIERLRILREGFSEDQFLSRVNEVFKLTEVSLARDSNRLPHNVGKGKLNSPGVIFSDATNKLTNEPLNNRQKNIAEAHEKLHGVLNDLSEKEKIQINLCFCFPEESTFNGYNSDQKEVECLARMSQLKNYFGFNTIKKKFTKEHLYFAKNHYVRDIGWDNNMTDFFNAIPKEKEDDFVALMNTVVC